MSTYSYTGRRIFQAIIMAVGIGVVAMAAADMARGDAQVAQNPAVQQFEVLTAFHNFMNETVGRESIDLIILAVGFWIVYFGLDGVLYRGPQLSFDAEGLRYIRFGRQTIPWDAMLDVRHIPRRRIALLRSEYIDLKLKEPKLYARRQPMLYRVFRRFTHPFDPELFTINGYDIEVPLRTVVERMQEVVEPATAAEIAQSSDG